MSSGCAPQGEGAADVFDALIVPVEVGLGCGVARAAKGVDDVDVAPLAAEFPRDDVGLVIAALDVALEVQRHGNEGVRLGQQAFGALGLGQSRSEKLTQCPTVVILHLVDEVLERIFKHAEADDFFVVGDSFADAIRTRRAVRRQRHRAELACGGGGHRVELRCAVAAQG
jgi:hypothetical protein